MTARTAPDRPVRLVATTLLAAALAAALAGCAELGVPTPLPAGSRQLVATVHNASDRPAVIVVARDDAEMGPVVGTAEPGEVPAGATVGVAIGIPPGRGWGIFVNPRAGRGPLLTQDDVPSGGVDGWKVTIEVGPDGSAGARSGHRVRPVARATGADSS